MERKYLLIIALLFTLFLIGCSSGDDAASDTGTKNATGEQTSGEPVEGGTLIVAYGAEPDTLDEMSSHFFHVIR